MKRIDNVVELQAWSDAVRSQDRRLALVPTMGALHEGHLSLVHIARLHADRVAVSVFVNPTQFGPGEDFEAYPRDLEHDLAKLRAHGVDLVFTPSVEELYPPGWSTWVEVDGRLTQGLCGRDRPGHFRGVTTVVARLFNAAKPHVAVFGEKDFQQLAVIRRMTRDLRLDIEIVGAPIVREPSGLAMSSRNQYLSGEELRQATSLNAALQEAGRLLRAGERDPATLVRAARERIGKEPLANIEYVELVHPETLEPLDEIETQGLLALAVRFSKARLIDNALLEVDGCSARS